MATRFIGIKEMCKLTGKSKPTLWRMYAKRKEFPAPVRTQSGSFLGWPETVYEEWVSQQTKEA
ncbi:AlpA family phage regulatory protein [Salmonella enterica]|nr:AlpA family phage regulatory protein [Salmonella enterica]